MLCDWSTRPKHRDGNGQDPVPTKRIFLSAAKEMKYMSSKMCHQIHAGASLNWSASMSLGSKSTGGGQNDTAKC